MVLCLGAERDGLPGGAGRCGERRAIPLRADGPDSLNVAMAATVALYELAYRMARPWLTASTQLRTEAEAAIAAGRLEPASSRSCACATWAASPS